MKKLALVMSLLLTTFMYGCDRNAEKFLTTQKFDAEVSFEVEVKSGYNLVEGTNSSAIRWNNYEVNPDKGGKPQLFVKYEISEPTENTEQNESFTNRYRDGLFANELDENLISAKFENPDQIYRVNLGDELKIITTFKKSKKYNFDYKSTADVVIKEDGDNIQVISKMTVKENENRNKPYADRNFKTVEEFTEYQLGFLSELDNKTTDFKAEELKLSKEYPFDVLPLFFATYNTTYNSGVTRNIALTTTRIQQYSYKDKESSDGPLTSNELGSVKSEGIEEYQKSLDYWEKFMISEFEVRT